MRNIFIDNDDGTTSIILKRRDNTKRKVLISTGDVDEVGVFNWCVSSNSLGKDYIHSNIKGKMIKLHRFITGDIKGKCVDHINGDTMDNTKVNLRVCTISENLHNRKHNKTNKVGMRGVSFISQTRKYRGSIIVRGKRYYTKQHIYPELAKRELEEMKKDVTI